jgi:hypothetical protein
VVLSWAVRGCSPGWSKEGLGESGEDAACAKAATTHDVLRTHAALRPKPPCAADTRERRGATQGYPSTRAGPALAVVDRRIGSRDSRGVESVVQVSARPLVAPLTLNKSLPLAVLERLRYSSGKVYTPRACRCPGPSA